jgi:hypothetical protein
MEINQSFEDFFTKRRHLEEELFHTGHKLTTWYEGRQGIFATLSDFAALELMLVERGRLLAELMKLDDDMLSQLVREHTKRKNDAS